MEESAKKDLEKAAQILKEFGAKEIFVFGSQADGTATKRSDLDLAVSGIPPEKFYKACGRVIMSIDHEVHIVDLDSSSPFIDYLKSSGEMRIVG